MSPRKKQQPITRISGDVQAASQARLDTAKAETSASKTKAIEPPRESFPLAIGQEQEDLLGRQIVAHHFREEES